MNKHPELGQGDGGLAEPEVVFDSHLMRRSGRIPRIRHTLPRTHPERPRGNAANFQRNAAGQDEAGHCNWRYRVCHRVDAFRISMHSLLYWQPRSVPTDGGWTQGQNSLQPSVIIPDPGMGHKRLSAAGVHSHTSHSQRNVGSPKPPGWMIARRGDRPPGLSVQIPAQAAQPRVPPLPRNDIRSTNPG